MQHGLSFFVLLLSVTICTPLFRDFVSRLRGKSKQRSTTVVKPATSASPTQYSTSRGDTVGTHLLTLTPLLLVFLSAEECNASPLNPQMISIRGPFFQGWLFRTVDHTQNVSAILIVGSFSPSRSGRYDEHYVFCGVDSNHHSLSLHCESFPAPETVTITGNLPQYLGDVANLTWFAQDLGYFHLCNEEGRLRFNLPGLDLQMNITSRKRWNDKHPSTGPEGWLGYTSLLPCHYMVHSVGSDCTYSISTDKCTVRGHGNTHIEGNHGTFFPDGWVWSQAISPGNKESLSLIGGRFVIGAIAPVNWVIFIRTEYCRYIFRTTDLDSISYEISPRLGSVKLSAVTFSGRTKLHLSIQSAPLAGRTYGPAIYIPTPHGFSNIPGCKETYTATAHAEVFSSSVDGEWESVHNVTYPLTALEFGGMFQHSGTLRKGWNVSE